MDVIGYFLYLMGYRIRFNPTFACQIRNSHKSPVFLSFGQITILFYVVLLDPYHQYAQYTYFISWQSGKDIAKAGAFILQFPNGIGRIAFLKN